MADLGIPLTHVVQAVLAPCDITRNHQTLDVHYYHRLLADEVYDIEVVQCVVAQLKMPKTLTTPVQSAIFDRSGKLSRAIWVSDE